MHIMLIPSRSSGPRRPMRSWRASRASHNAPPTPRPRNLFHEPLGQDTSAPARRAAALHPGGGGAAASGQVHAGAAGRRRPRCRGALRERRRADAARLASGAAGRPGAVLVLDEIQRIPGWSETVKRLWDEDTRKRVPLKVVLLGSAPLLIARGMSESLAGRFE